MPATCRTTCNHILFFFFIQPDNPEYLYCVIKHYKERHSKCKHSASKREWNSEVIYRVIVHSFVCFIQVKYFNSVHKRCKRYVLKPSFKINPDCDLCWYLITQFSIYSHFCFHVTLCIRIYVCVCECTLYGHWKTIFILHTIFNWMEASESAARVYDTITTSMVDFIFHSAIRPIYWWNSYWVCDDWRSANAVIQVFLSTFAIESNE